MPLSMIPLQSTILYVTAVLLYTQYSIPGIQGVPVEKFFEFNLATGETLLPPGDDLDLEFTLNVPFLFYDKSYNKITVNTNGILAFGEDPDVNFTPVHFPRNSTDPVIAPYWADVDTRGIGMIYARNIVDNTDVTIDKVKSLVATHFEGFPNFVAEEIFMVTWHKVGYYSAKTDKVNTFQCVLASDGTNTFAIFLYLDDGINWTTGDASGGTDGLGGIRAQVGFDAGNSNDYTAVEGSFTADIINIEEKSNVGVPGLFIFQISGSDIRSGEEPCPIVGSSACMNRIKDAACSVIYEAQKVQMRYLCLAVSGINASQLVWLYIYRGTARPLANELYTCTVVSSHAYNAS